LSSAKVESRAGSVAGPVGGAEWAHATQIPKSSDVFMERRWTRLPGLVYVEFIGGWLRPSS